MCHNGAICKDLAYATDQNPNCHVMADWGADIYLGERYTSDLIYETNWYFPTFEIKQVYASMGIKSQS
jgi:hypothetical protein